MEIHYMSWLKNRLGKSAETAQVPDHILTPEQLVEWLSGREEIYKILFSHRSIIRISVNNQVVYDWQAPLLKKNDKVVFFSAMAGG